MVLPGPEKSLDRLFADGQGAARLAGPPRLRTARAPAGAVRRGDLVRPAQRPAHRVRSGRRSAHHAAGPPDRRPRSARPGTRLWSEHGLRQRGWAQRVDFRGHPGGSAGGLRRPRRAGCRVAFSSGRESLGPVVSGDDRRQGTLLPSVPAERLAAGRRPRRDALLRGGDGRPGNLLKTHLLPPAPLFWQSRSWPDYFSRRLQSPAFFLGGLAYQKIGALFGSQRLADQLARRIGPDAETTRQSAVCIALLSLVLAAATWVWARRARFSSRRALAWTLFVLAGGLAGFITFRAAADWPRFVPCWRCRRPRPLDAGSCPECGAGWPATASEGTEIFDHDAASVLAAARP